MNRSIVMKALAVIAAAIAVDESNVVSLVLRKAAEIIGLVFGA